MTTIHRARPVGYENAPSPLQPFSRHLCDVVLAFEIEMGSGRREVRTLRLASGSPLDEVLRALDGDAPRGSNPLRHLYHPCLVELCPRERIAAVLPIGVAEAVGAAGQRCGERGMR